MRKQLKAIHDSASDHYGIQAELPIKVEPVYEITDFKHESEVLFNRSGRQQRGNYRGRARSYGNNRNNQSRNQSYGNARGARNWSGNNSRQTKKILSIALAIPQGVQYVSQCTTGLETVQIKEKILIMLK